MRNCRCWLVLACFGLALTASVGPGSPIKPVAPEEALVAAGDERIATYELRGQEETRVIASGRDPFYVGLYVFDAHGNCVAWDDYGVFETREDCGVVFVPPVDGSYRVYVRNMLTRQEANATAGVNQIRVAVR